MFLERKGEKQREGQPSGGSEAGFPHEGGKLRSGTELVWNKSEACSAPQPLPSTCLCGPCFSLFQM